VPTRVEPAASWRRAVHGDVPAVVALALVLVPVALVRFVDGDEGVYAYAGRLVLEGHVPYGGFFYEQMPLVPYAYGAWMGVAGESWYAVRVLSALLAVAIGVLLFRHVRRRLGPGGATVALFVYATSGLVLGYFTIVKTFALATLLLFAAYVLVAGGRATERRFLVAGVLLGLSLDARLLFVAAVPAFAVATLRARRVRPFATGLGAALIPAIALLTLHPRAFAFDNVGYHALKTSAGLVGDVHQKGQTAATLLGLESTDRGIGIQYVLLAAACTALLAVPRWRGRAPLALGIAASLAVASFLPTPSYVQYFAVTVPFLAIGAAEVAARARRPREVLALAACVVVYMGASVSTVRHLADHDPLLRPSIGSVRAVGARVERAAAPGERVLSSWPGYLLETRARALPDYVNQFAPAAAARISSRTARLVHVASERELERRIRHREVRLVVYRNWITTRPFARWDRALTAGRYRLVARVQTAGIYVR
jgi:hypothetical protein